MNKTFIVIFGVGLLIATGSFAFKYQMEILEGPKVPVFVDQNPKPNPLPTEEPKELPPQEEPPKIQSPAEININLPFYAQAPFANWSYPWEEACEEASALLVANYYLNKGWTREQFNEEILKLVDWQVERFGDYKHTNIAQTEEILNDYLNLKSIIHKNPSFEDVKKILAKNHLIVMTFAGKKLGNPNYQNGGPVYHAMVIKGYNDATKEIIVHDVGTSRGENYVYSWNTISEALHDYAVPIENGEKLMIEVLPE